MKQTKLKSRKVSTPSAILREMKPGSYVMIKTTYVKTSILRVTATKLKHEGYKFRVSEKGLLNETIVQCIKIPTL